MASVLACLVRFDVSASITLSKLHPHLGFIAKKLCPELIFVKINGARYNEMSKKVMAIFKRYDPTMCPAGCDEGYLK